MFVDAAVTSKLVEQALPLMPFLDDGQEFATYDLLEEWKERFKKTGKGPKPDDPDKWSVRISAPLMPEMVEVGHEQVFAALGTIAFHDRDTSPWGQATQDLQEWLFLPDSVSGLEHKPSNAAAVAVLLAALYGDKAHLFLTESNRYLQPTHDEK
ncbi:hypothetical protein ACFRQM_47585 [Streptomyces sp. NPDC056831]|uniref:hypothetical protein n=1 Tax=Streptomyces sp. NPDC056831 TaxID=3345954 RepID=UPI0036900F20